MLRPGERPTPLADSFTKMVELASELTVRAGKIYFRETTDPQELNNLCGMNRS